MIWILRREPAGTHSQESGPVAGPTCARAAGACRITVPSTLHGAPRRLRPNPNASRRTIETCQVSFQLNGRSILGSVAVFAEWAQQRYRLFDKSVVRSFTFKKNAPPRRYRSAVRLSTTMPLRVRVGVPRIAPLLFSLVSNRIVRWRAYRTFLVSGTVRICRDGCRSNMPPAQRQCASITPARSRLKSLSICVGS